MLQVESQLARKSSPTILQVSLARQSASAPCHGKRCSLPAGTAFLTLARSFAFLPLLPPGNVSIVGSFAVSFLPCGCTFHVGFPLSFAFALAFALAFLSVPLGSTFRLLHLRLVRLILPPGCPGGHTIFCLRKGSLRCNCLLHDLLELLLQHLLRSKVGYLLPPPSTLCLHLSPWWIHGGLSRQPAPS